MGVSDIENTIPKAVRNRLSLGEDGFHPGFEKDLFKFNT